MDDDDGVRELTATSLERLDERFAVRSENDPVTALDSLDEATVDCIVSDYRVPDMDDLEDPSPRGPP